MNKDGNEPHYWSVHFVVSIRGMLLVSGEGSSEGSRG